MRLVNQLLPRIAFLAALAAAAAGPLHAGSWCGNPVPECSLTKPTSPCYQPPKPDQRCEPRVCGKCTKSPCYVGSGAYVSSAIDLELPTPGFTLLASRHYESTHTIDGPMGHGWNSSLTAHLYYATYLLMAPNFAQREANIVMPDGARYRFVEDGVGAFTPPLGRHDTLVRNPDGSFDLAIQRSMSKFHFNAEGMIETMTDDYGNTLRYRYDGNGLLFRVDDLAGSGRFIDVYWGADGRISDLVDVAGRQVSFAYDAAGLLVASTDPVERTTHYTYAAGRYVPLLQSISDNWGRLVTSVTFDSKDRVATYSDRGATFFYTYNFQNNPLKTAKTDSEGRTWVYEFGPGGLVTKETPPSGTGGSPRESSYYADGLPLGFTDSLGSQTSFTYTVDGAISSITSYANSPNAIRRDYEYGTAFPGRRTSVKVRDASSGAIEPDWQSWRFDYYDLGTPAPGALHFVRRLGSDGVASSIVETYAYDSRGNVTSITDADGVEFAYEYDAAGNAVTATRSPNNTEGVRPSTFYTYDSLGRPLSKTDEMGSVTSFSWDPVGRLLSVTQPPPSLNSAMQYVTSYTYDIFDVTSGLVNETVTDYNGIVLTRGYDAFGRQVLNTNGLGATYMRAYSNGRLAEETDPNGNTSRFNYDALGRLAFVEFPDLSRETYAYYANGALQSKTDRKGQITSFTYDYAGRLAAKAYADGSSISYSFSGEKLTQIEDTSTVPPETHSFTYDDGFRVQSETQGERGAIIYEYSAAGRRIRESALGGETTMYEFYPDGSVSSIDWSPAEAPFAITYNLRGQYDEIVFPNGQVRSHSYDLQGRPMQIATSHPVTGTIAEYAFGYDTDNALQQPGMLGQRTSMVANVPQQGLTNALTKYYYDRNYQLTRVDYPSAAPFNSEIGAWTYDPAGNRLSESQNGVVLPYSYLSNSGGLPSSHTLVSDGLRSYSSDGNGSITSIVSGGSSQSFVWDFEDRPKVRTTDSTSTSGFDFRTRRTTSIQGGSVAERLYSGDSVVKVQGSVSEAYLHGPLRDELLGIFKDGSVYFAVTDDRDSVVMATDSSGNAYSSSIFDAWGLTRASFGSAIRFGYLGQEGEGGGFWLHGPRIYNPRTGQFLQQDPGGTTPLDRSLWTASAVASSGEPGLPDSLNRGYEASTTAPAINVTERTYAYARNNPVFFRDSGGRVASPAWILIPYFIVEYARVWECKKEFEKCWEEGCRPRCDCDYPGGRKTGDWIACDQRCRMRCDAQTRCVEKLIIREVLSWIKSKAKAPWGDYPSKKEIN